MLDKTSCPYCRGTLFVDTGYTEKMIEGHKTLYPYATPCTCEINRQLSKRFEIFSKIPDVLPEDAEKVMKRYTKDGVVPNMILYGDEGMFLYVVKCFFVHGFTHRDYMILEGANIVERYHVPRNDAWLTISVLDQYDLLVILFTSYTEYQTLKSCVADVIKNRTRISKPTWIYAKDRSSLEASKEYSKDIKPLLEEFVERDVSKTFDYAGYSEKASDKIVKKRVRDVNDNLGRRGV